MAPVHTVGDNAQVTGIYEPITVHVNAVADIRIDSEVGAARGDT